MPIRYSISPELNIVFLFGEGRMTDVEYVHAAQAVLKDSAYKQGMIRIADLFSASEDFELRNIFSAIEYVEDNVKKGIAPDHTVLLSRSTGIHQIVQALKLLSTKVPLKLDVFDTLEDAIASLGLSEVRQAVIDYYNQTKFEGK